MKRYLVLLFLFGLSVSGLAQTAKTRSETTQCAAFPCVVASVQLTNQSQQALQVPIYTPPADGLFRISAYEETQEINGVSGGFWRFTFGWTDPLLHRTIQGDVYNDSWSVLWAPINIRAVAGQPIAYSVKPGGGNPGVTTWNLYITVEQLQ
jgi:hypothetical protein